MPPKRKPRVKKVSIPREIRRPPPPSPPPAPPPRAERVSAAERIHGNVGFARTVSELLRHHPRLQDAEPAVVDKDVFKFTQGRRVGSLIQTHVRFKFDYPEVQQFLLTVFARLFGLQGNSQDAFEVVITFNAILHCQDSNTYSVFYGTDFRENNRMGAAQELGYGDTYVIHNLQQVASNLPVNFDMQDLIYRHRDAFPNSNVSVFQILNIIYLIYQYRQ